MITMKKLKLFLSAKRIDPFAPSANDNYNKVKFGILSCDFKEISIALHRTFGMFPPNNFSSKDIKEMNENYNLYLYTTGAKT